MYNLTVARCRKKSLMLAGILCFTVTPPLACCAEAQTSNTATRNATVWLAPPTEFYPQYIADPRRAQSALMVLKFSDSEIPNAGTSRTVTRLGGRYSLARFHPKNNPHIGWQIDLEAGFFGQFDLMESWDNLGWDGVYGLLFCYKPKPQLGIRFGTLHDSAHLGDEYAEETGRQRINYTREELVVGATWSAHQQWRYYAEAAWAYEAAGPEKDERVQFGIEYFSLRKTLYSLASWYAAADFNFFHERNWSPATTVQIGLIIPTTHADSRYRVATEVYHGRSQMGELSFHDETYIGLGLFYDI